MKNMSEKNKRKQNRLINEKSPYLLQHAENPVDWYPWGDEAFEKAVKENKPIFLSIGYSTCHWCHVMEKESFEDPEVAELMNDTFVSIKVDREERPDIDSTYMQVCQMMTGSGGWPLTIFMTPEKKPFYAATYIPKEARFGRSGLMELIPHIKNLWTEKQDDLLASSNQITLALQQVPKVKPGRELDETTLKLTYNQLLRNFDTKYGGFGSAPKFPSPHNILFLLRYWKRSNEKRALSMVEKTLQDMRKGGIYDHVGFGFHRYSTDEHWLVPHFEKMLYDQALLAMAYTETFQATGKEEYAKTARETFEYILRDMTSPEGGFYSAEDADSEGKEGKFYVWKMEEVKGVLDKSEFELAKKFLTVKQNGNFTDPMADSETRENILHQTRSYNDLAGEMGILVKELEERVEKLRAKLFDYREMRVHPHKDDKILTDWNGLMIAALAKASAAFDEPKFSKASGYAVDFILKKLRSDSGRLLHRYRDGDAAIPAQLDDYSFLIWGLIELYESTFDEKYLTIAGELNDELMEYLWDPDNGGFYLTASDAEELLIRNKDIYDGAIPSGNSVAFLNLIRLAKLNKEPLLEQKASGLNKAFSKQVGNVPRGHTMFMTALDFAVGPSKEVLINGDPGGENTKKLISAIRTNFIPNIVVLLNPSEKKSTFSLPLPDTQDANQTELQDAVAYVCTNYSCQEPTSDANRMLELLKIRVNK